jgi:hypothetical protein
VLAHFFEEEGLPTTQISLIREHTERIKPPRALWVPFELGRPLGVPNEPAFQKRVLLATLKLLEATSGPVLEDFPEDAPVSASEGFVLAGPVSFAQEAIELTEPETLCASFKREILSMRSWYDTAMRKRGRTTVGVSQLGIESVGDFMCQLLDGKVPENPRQDISIYHILKFAADDLRAYYVEGITAQPGQESLPSKVISDCFWKETVAGKVLLEVREVCLKNEDGEIQAAGRALVPREVVREMGR